MKKMISLRAALLLAGAAAAMVGCKQEDLQSEVTANEGASCIITASMPSSEGTQKLSHTSESGVIRTNWYNATNSENFYGVMNTPLNNAGYQYCRFIKSESTVNASKSTFNVNFRFKDGTFSTVNDNIYEGQEFYVMYCGSNNNTLGGTGDCYYKQFDKEMVPEEVGSGPDKIHISLKGQTGRLISLQNYDFMWAKGTASGDASNEGTTKLNFQFKHLLSFLHFKGIKFVDENGNLFTEEGNEIMKIVIRGGAGSFDNARISLLDGKISGKNASVKETTSRGEVGSIILESSDIEDNFHIINGQLDNDIYVAVFPYATPPSGSASTTINNSKTEIFIVLGKWDETNGVVETHRFKLRDNSNLKPLPTGGIVAGKSYLIDDVFIKY